MFGDWRAFRRCAFISFLLFFVVAFSPSPNDSKFSFVFVFLLFFITLLLRLILRSHFPFLFRRKLWRGLATARHRANFNFVSLSIESANIVTWNNFAVIHKFFSALSLSRRQTYKFYFIYNIFASLHSAPQSAATICFDFFLLFFSSSFKANEKNRRRRNRRERKINEIKLRRK